MADVILISEWVYLLRVCVWKDFALPLILCAYSWTHKERDLSSACIFQFSVRFL